MRCLLLQAWDHGEVVPILLCHAIDNEPCDLSTDPCSFREYMSWLAESANLIALSDLEALLSGNKPVRRPVVVTFDDGLSSVYEEAFPVLRELQIPFGLFLTTGLVGKSFLLHGLNKPMLSWQQIQEMLDSGRVGGDSD